ncbi:MAG TPA: rhomboid family intramembrane serine protease [Bacteroidota bacterium]|nr:rhomboid family intramembrane serine protease [Bacteroidota bacterium]
MSNYYRPSMFGGFSFFPPVIKLLMILNAMVFLTVTILGNFTIGGYPLYEFFHYYFGLMPIGYGFYPWQLITYQFMHADFWHLFFNMVFGLWMFGMEIEHLWGSRKFLYFYLMCGVAAGLFQLALAPILEPSQSIAPTVGASGAVYGILLAFGMLFPDRYIYLYFFVPIKAKYFIAGLILIGVLAIGNAGNVANLAHLGGALAGYLYILYDQRRLPFAETFERWRWKMEQRAEEKQREQKIVEAKFFDIREAQKKEERDVTQQKIDEILDKISRSGYQNLTEEEKKILFEASKKLN